MATLLGMNAQQAFEENKDNGQVKALLKLLGIMREKVVEWKIDNHAYDPNYATFRAVFNDESEARGWLSFMPQHDKWGAGGTIIPAFQAKRIAAMNAWLDEYNA